MRRADSCNADLCTRCICFAVSKILR